MENDEVREVRCYHYETVDGKKKRYMTRKEILSPSVNNKHITSLIPAAGYLAFFHIEEKPYFCTEKVIAWGAVRSYSEDGDYAIEANDILALVLDGFCGTLEPAETSSNFVGICEDSDLESIERMTAETIKISKQRIARLEKKKNEL